MGVICPFFDFVTEVLQNIVSREESSVASREITFFHQTVIKAKNRDKTLFNSTGYNCQPGPRWEVRFSYKSLIYNVKNPFIISSVASREITFFHQAVIKARNRGKNHLNSIGYIFRSGLRREVRFLYKLLICRVKIHLSKAVLYLNYSLT